MKPGYVVGDCHARTTPHTPFDVIVTGIAGSPPITSPRTDGRTLHATCTPLPSSHQTVVTARPMPYIPLIQSLNSLTDRHRNNTGTRGTKQRKKTCERPFAAPRGCFLKVRGAGVAAMGHHNQHALQGSPLCKNGGMFARRATFLY